MHQMEAERRQSDRRWLVSGVLIPTFAIVVAAIGIIVTLVTVH